MIVVDSITSVVREYGEAIAFVAHGFADFADVIALANAQEEQIRTRHYEIHIWREDPSFCIRFEVHLAFGSERHLKALRRNTIARLRERHGEIVEHPEE